MYVNGCGGSFVAKTYNITREVAWEIGLLVMKEMAVTITDEDKENFLINGIIDTGDKTLLFRKPVTKIFTFAIEKLESGIQVIVDAHKERIEAYSLKPQNKETKAFFEIFDQKLEEYNSSVTCPKCGAKVPVNNKFCPECGHKLKA